MFLAVQGDTTVNAEIVERYAVRLYPTFLALDADGEILQRWIGFDEAAAWGEIVESIKADPITVAHRRARHAAHPSFADAFALGRHVYASGSSREAMELYRQARSLDPDAPGASELPIMLFRAAYRGLRSEEVAVGEFAALGIAIVQAPSPNSAEVLEVTYRLGTIVDRLGREQFASILEMAYPIVAPLQDEALRDRQREFLVHHALYVEEDVPKAVAMRRAALPAGWESDPLALNGFAWWCFEQRVNLAEAEQLAQRAAESADADAVRANILDTQAQLVFLRGNTEQAITLLEQAIEIAPDTPYFREQRDRFRGSATTAD